MDGWHLGAFYKQEASSMIAKEPERSKLVRLNKQNAKALYELMRKERKNYGTLLNEIMKEGLEKRGIEVAAPEAAKAD